MIQKMIKTILLLALVVFLTACQTEKQEIENPQIRILYWDEESFLNKYGNMFLATHPDYKIEVVPLKGELEPGKDPIEIIKKMIQNKQPDIIQTDLDAYKILVKQNLLLSLDEFMKQDGYNLDDYVPAVLDALKDKESGVLYGLSATFNGLGLYYNKNLFVSHGIPLPKERMTWDEVFQLAERFPKQITGSEKPLFGFYHKYSLSPFMMALNIGEGGGLSIYNPANKQFSIHTDAWNKVFETIIRCIKSGACYQVMEQKESDKMDEYSILKRNYPFLEGNIAMAVEQSSMLRTVTASQKPFDEFAWGVVSMPVHPENPDMGNGISMNEVFSIPSGSLNKEAAWEFIKYISGESYGKIAMRTNGEELPARKSLSEKEDNPGIESFYKLEQTNNNIVEYLRLLPPEIIGQLDQSASKYLGEVLAGKLAVAKALEAIQNEVQSVMEKPAL
ncbi:ABC transporter substrate-binding protein [Paenibacillus apiarius]|uniref:Extracellular solute-binding protein n=1 Tax=Paenibacillus apiarius TaxID=46240 RepID=A0ABT4DXX4_9BACL|nr:extracellular solute-binding protein [Paenibacillus apiarius]MCY9517520.1 extracellular solute-binding protein [Paenibacillus apiarius]MCY9522201.1 extracellular solute-binding protein [Paenibacillus apiarius]MCY9552235.1 extracellular solute-binding protein [Paenibacillus apiarius]MCY9560114.1 extracellular solute-binding protein [Paenibacillus apiarius]MCY9683732.1 extracellular solute-binding protein [Paenibacillus apiarius]